MLNTLWPAVFVIAMGAAAGYFLTSLVSPYPGFSRVVLFITWAAFGQVIVWFAVSVLLVRVYGRPLLSVLRSDAWSYSVNLVLLFSAPYFRAGGVSTRFFPEGIVQPQAKVIAVAILALVVVGTLVFKVIIFSNRSDGALAWLDRRATLLIGIWVGLYIASFLTLDLWSYHLLRYFSDLGEYNQTIWATLRGNFYYTTLDEGGPTYLASHFPPFLLAILPFYALFPSPQTIVVLRTLALGLAAVPLFLIARTRLTPFAALVLAVSFSLAPQIAAQHLRAGYESAFAAVFFLAAFYFFERNKIWLFLLFLVLTMSVRENFAFVGVIFAGYALLRRRPWSWSATAGVLGVGWLFLSSLVIANYQINSEWNEYYAQLGNTGGEVFRTILTRPLFVLEYMFRTQDNFFYNIFMPYGFGFPFLSVTSVFALPDILMNALKAHDFDRAAGVTHYVVLISASFFLGLIMGIQRLSKWLASKNFARSSVLLATFAFLLTLASSHQWLDVLPLGRDSDLESRRAVISLIPPDSSVATNYGNLVPPLSSRRYIYRPWRLQVPPRNNFPELASADYVIVKLPFNDSVWKMSDAFEFLNSPGAGERYTVIFDRDNLKVYRRNKGGG